MPKRRATARSTARSARTKGRRQRPAEVEDDERPSDDSDAAPTPRSVIRKGSKKAKAKKKDPYEITLVMMEPDYMVDKHGDPITIDNDWICNIMLRNISGGVYLRSLVRLIKYDPEQPRKLPKEVTATPAVYDHQLKRYFIGSAAVDHFHAWLADEHGHFIDLDDQLFGSEAAGEYELGEDNGYAERKKKRIRTKAKIKGDRLDDADILSMDRPMRSGAAVRGDAIVSTQLTKGLAPKSDKIGKLPVYDIGDRPDVKGARRGGNRVIKASEREDKSKITDADIEKAMRRRQRAADRRKGGRKNRTQHTMDDVSDDGSYSDDDEAEFKRREKKRRARYAKAKKMMQKGGHKRQRGVKDEDYDSEQEYELDDRQRRKRGQARNRGQGRDQYESDSDVSEASDDESSVSERPARRGKKTAVITRRTSRFEHDSDEEDDAPKKSKSSKTKKTKKPAKKTKKTPKQAASPPPPPAAKSKSKKSSKKGGKKHRPAAE